MKWILLTALLLVTPCSGSAQELHQELQETVRAEVVKILTEEERDIIGTDTQVVVQEVLVEIKGGEKRGERVAFQTDLMPLELGDAIYVNRLVGVDGVEYYQFKDVDRSFALITLVLAFAFVLMLFAGKHGARAILSLTLSVLILFFVLVPLLLAGYSPVLVSVLVAGPVLAAMLFLTHGFHPRVYIAFFGTFGAVIVTSMVTIIWVQLSRFTGLSSDEAIFLNF